MNEEKRPAECIGACVLQGYRAPSETTGHPRAMDAYCSTCGADFGEMKVSEAEALFKECAASYQPEDEHIALHI